MLQICAVEPYWNDACSSSFVWKVHFIATKYYLDYGVLEQEVSSPLLAMIVHDIDLIETLNSTLDSCMEWLKAAAAMFKDTNGFLNKKMLATKKRPRQWRSKSELI